MKVLPLLPSWAAVLIGAVEATAGAVQGMTSEPTLGLQLLNSGLIITIGGALIASHIRFKDKATEQSAKDRALAAEMVQEAKDEAEEKMNAMHTQNQAVLAKIADSMQEMSILMYGARGRSGVIDDLEYSSDIRHQMLDRQQGVEAYLHNLSEFLGGKLADCPHYHTPPPLQRRRRRGDAQ